MLWFVIGILIFVGFVIGAARLMMNIKPPSEKSKKDDDKDQ
jgi:hypothetical protein